tara:strand:+ start:647 stop:856 length:210 start_codon:yes stop_codon:yes gene_type:complete
MEINKFGTAILILKPNVEATWSDEISTEEDFKKVKWVTGVAENGIAITTTTNPHSEITWAKVKEEMDKL